MILVKQIRHHDHTQSPSDGWSSGEDSTTLLHPRRQRTSIYPSGSTIVTPQSSQYGFGDVTRFPPTASKFSTKVGSMVSAKYITNKSSSVGAALISCVSTNSRCHAAPN